MRCCCFTQSKKKKKKTRRGWISSWRTQIWRYLDARGGGRQSVVVLAADGYSTVRKWTTEDEDGREGGNMIWGCTRTRLSCLLLPLVQALLRAFPSEPANCMLKSNHARRHAWLMCVHAQLRTQIHTHTHVRSHPQSTVIHNRALWRHDVTHNQVSSICIHVSRVLHRMSLSLIQRDEGSEQHHSMEENGLEHDELSAGDTQSVVMLWESGWHAFNWHSFSLKRGVAETYETGSVSLSALLTRCIQGKKMSKKYLDRNAWPIAEPQREWLWGASPSFPYKWITNGRCCITIVIWSQSILRRPPQLTDHILHSNGHNSVIFFKDLELKCYH